MNKSKDPNKENTKNCGAEGEKNLMGKACKWLKAQPPFHQHNRVHTLSSENCVYDIFKRLCILPLFFDFISYITLDDRFIWP